MNEMDEPWKRFVIGHVLTKWEKGDNGKRGSYIMTLIMSNNDVGMESATLAYSSCFKRLETAAANRSKGSGAVARVICPRQGWDARLITSYTSAV